MGQRSAKTFIAGSIPAVASVPSNSQDSKTTGSGSPDLCRSTSSGYLDFIGVGAGTAEVPPRKAEVCGTEVFWLRFTHAAMR